MYYQARSPGEAHFLFTYRNFKSDPVPPGGYSKLGLAISALHTVRVLRRNRVRADVHAVDSAADIGAAIDRYQTVTHCIIEAPWMETAALADLLAHYPHVHFISRCHSQIGFLQVEPRAIKLIREYLSLQDTSLNFNFSANSQRFVNFVQEGYRADCLYLPNLYDDARPSVRPGVAHNHRLLRIGGFGAIRTLKNHPTSAAAAMLIARRRNADLEFHINVNREEHGSGVLHALRHMFRGLPTMRLIENPWRPWDGFRQLVSAMDLCMQVSSTETFNLVSADAAAEGVPSVVSHAIEWMPDPAKAHVDDVEEIARVGETLLWNAQSGQQAAEALADYNASATQVWLAYLAGNPRP